MFECDLILNAEWICYHQEQTSKFILFGGERDNKHLMTGPKGKSDFCLTPLSVPRREAKGNIN